MGILKCLMLVLLVCIAVAVIPVFIALAGFLLPVIAVLSVFLLPGALIGVLVAWFMKK